MNVHEETAKAFSELISSYDQESNWIYTNQAIGMLKKLDRQLVRLYEAGCLSLKDFKKFDNMILNRSIKIEA